MGNLRPSWVAVVVPRGRCGRISALLALAEFIPSLHWHLPPDHARSSGPVSYSQNKRGLEKPPPSLGQGGDGINGP